ncbi:MAG: TonB-dependent receptor plug domain-containing protein, partial [Thermoanaerobaculia bacterium]
GLHGGIDLRYGSAAESMGVHGSLSRRGERAALQLDASVREADDYEAPSGRFGDVDLDESTPVLDTGLDDDSLSGTFLWDATPSQELSVKLTRYRADQAGFGLVEPEVIGDTSGARIRILYPFQDFDRYTVGWVGSDLGTTVADVIEARLYYQDNERELANDIDIAVPPPAPGAPGLLIEADTLNFTDLETWGARLEGRKGTTDHRHLISYGLEGYRDDSFNTDFSETTVSLTFPFPPFVLPIDVATDDVANAPNAENTSWGVFAQGEIAATDRLQVVAGGRYQSVETRAEATPGWDTTGLDFDDDHAVGAISALVQVTPELRLYGSFGTAFRAPNIIERLFNGVTPEGIGFQILNPALGSETSENIDLGVKYRRDNAVFELTLFRNDIDDGIVQYFLTAGEVAALPPDLQEDIRNSGAVFVVQQRNADRLRYEGVEVAAGYRGPRDLAFGLNYTYLDAERLDSANPPTGDTYSDKVNVFARWEPLDRPFWAEARARHNGDDELNLQPGEPVPVVGTTLPSFTVVSLAGGWTFRERDSQRHELFARLENATDELYSESSNAPFFRPQPERDLRIGYRLRL